MTARRATAEWIRATATVVLTAAAIAVVIRALWRAQLALTLTVLALLVAVALDRIVAWLEARGLRRGLAIAAVMLAVVGTLAALGLLFVPPAIRQMQQLVQSGPGLLRGFEHGSAYEFLRRHAATALDELRQRGPALASRLVGEALSIATAVAEAIAGLVTLLFVVVFMLASGRQLVWSALAKARPERRPIYADVLRKLYRSLGGYIGGLFLLVLSNMLFSGVFLGVIGVPYFLPLAVFAGLCSLVPYAGAITAGAVLSLVAWGTKGVWFGVGTLGYFIAYEQVESHILAPLVYRRTVDLNPLVILLVVLFMADLNGIAGAIVAVPLAATVQIVLRELFRLRRERLHLPRVAPGPELLDPAAQPVAAPSGPSDGDDGHEPAPRP